MRVSPWLLMASVIAAPVLAGELAGVEMPDQVTVEGRTLSLNGLGLREATMLKVDVYVAGLYLERRSSDPGAILDSSELRRVSLEFVRDVARAKMVEAWEDGFEKNLAGDRGAFADRIKTFLEWVGDVKTGDRIAYTFLPGHGVRVEVNGSERGTIPGDDFARLLLSVWLGASPPNPELKHGMLGLRR